MRLFASTAHTSYAKYLLRRHGPKVGRTVPSSPAIGPQAQQCLFPPVFAYTSDAQHLLKSRPNSAKAPSNRARRAVHAVRPFLPAVLACSSRSSEQSHSAGRKPLSATNSCGAVGSSALPQNPYAWHSPSWISCAPSYSAFSPQGARIDVGH